MQSTVLIKSLFLGGRLHYLIVQGQKVGGVSKNIYLCVLLGGKGVRWKKKDTTESASAVNLNLLQRNSISFSKIQYAL